MPKLRRAYRVALVFLFLCLLTCIGLFAYSNTPSPLVITDTVGNASVRFETLDHIILNDTACYRVQWQVSGIEGVYLNDSGKIGEGQERLCYDESSEPELRVDFEDGTTRTYTLEIVLLPQQPGFWLVIAIAILLSVFSFYFFILPFLGMTIRTPNQMRFTVITLIALILLAIVAVSGLLELGLRFYFTNFGTEDDRILYIYNSEQIQDAQSRQTGAPFVKYVNNPTYNGHNELGFRGDPVDIDKPEDTYRIIAVGSSTTYGFGLNAYQAYPFVLQEILREDYGYAHVEVINAGVIGYTSYEILTNFQFRLLEFDPDLIIYYGGKSDLEARDEDPGCFNNVSPLYGLSTNLGLWRTEFADIPDSALIRFFAINTNMMQPPNSTDFSFRPIPLEKTCQSGERYTRDERIQLNSSHFNDRNLRNLFALTQFHGIDVMISELIYPTRLDQVEGDEALIMSETEQQAIVASNQLLSEFADEFGMYYYPLGDDFVIEPRDFWTSTHLRVAGTEKQAELYAQFIHDNNIIVTSASDK